MEMIAGTMLHRFIGDEHGSLSVLKYDSEDAKLLQLPYHISANSLKEAAGFPSPDHQPIVGVLPQPHSSGNRQDKSLIIVLIAYQDGLIVLWDVSEGRTLFVGGGKDLQLKDDSKNEVDPNIPEDTEEKEITALSWASSNGSILAVGYLDGDILFWKTSTASSTRGQKNELTNSNIVKLQLSSSEKRLPIIVLHWSISDRPSNDGDGRLFIYGGDEIGSEEVLTVLTLEWSSGMETVRCVGRMDITLAGSFADMILLPSSGPTEGNPKAAVSVLANPGQLHIFDDASLSSLPSRQKHKATVLTMGFPMVVPTVDPHITVAKLITLPLGGNSSKILSEIASAKKRRSTPFHGGSANWPLTGGVPSHLSFTEHADVERVYIAGYLDGSVRIWDATYPDLSLICIVEGEVESIAMAGLSDPVTKLDFCSLTQSLAVGNKCGLVRIYNLNGSSDETTFHYLIDTKHEVHTLPQGKGPPLRAVFSLLNSPILALQFANYGAKLAVGLECGHVVVLDTSSLAVLFTTESVSSSCSPVISVNWVGCINTCSLVKSPKHSDSNMPITPTEQVMFFLTKDATLYMIDGGTEGIPSVPDLTDGKQLEESGQNLEAKNESEHTTNSTGISSHNNDHHSSVNTLTRERLLDSFILLCCVDSLQLYSTKNVIQITFQHFCTAHLNSISSSNIVDSAYIYLDRSFSGLELVKETSLMSILRWNFKANMEKMMSCDNGQITLAHGCELAFISLFSGENFSRIPESFPCLHDKVLAAAADAAFNFSSNQKKQGIKPGILDGIVKGFKGRKVDHSVVINPSPKSDFSHLEAAFSKQPFSDSYRTAVDSEEVVELHIDDIEIDDEPSLPTATTSSQEVKHMKREKRSQREQLLGVTDDMKPKLRTPEEIMAKYRKAEDASSVAARAREKLLQRQEKLERISRRTAELQSGAEDFSSMANELVNNTPVRDARLLLFVAGSNLCSARQGFSLQDKQFLCFLHRNRYGNTGPAHMATKSSHEAQSKKREKRDGRENLLGFGDETRHRSRNLKEIVSKYRKSKDPSSLAMSAKNKLVQRQEKLDKLSNQAEELEGTSEDYASMTNELLKKMEKRKWWQI
uniref:V-SNARE coiled-coil homology domain-containing protein n=1 Tax=Salix viminalis TaxID=40686 RepID=A0A6N2KRJ9_SALVM